MLDGSGLGFGAGFILGCSNVGSDFDLIFDLSLGCSALGFAANLSSDCSSLGLNFDLSLGFGADFPLLEQGADEELRGFCFGFAEDSQSSLKE